MPFSIILHLVAATRWRETNPTSEACEDTNMSRPVASRTPVRVQRAHRRPRASPLLLRRPARLPAFRKRSLGTRRNMLCPLVLIPNRHRRLRLLAGLSLCNDPMLGSRAVLLYLALALAQVRERLWQPLPRLFFLTALLHILLNLDLITLRYHNRPFVRLLCLLVASRTSTPRGVAYHADRLGGD